MSEKFDHDVIVIGGGPAGSTVARYAALGGANVLVVDEKGLEYFNSLSGN